MHTHTTRMLSCTYPLHGLRADQCDTRRRPRRGAQALPHVFAVMRPPRSRVNSRKTVVHELTTVHDEASGQRQSAGWAQAAGQRALCAYNSRANSTVGRRLDHLACSGGRGGRHRQPLGPDPTSAAHHGAGYRSHICMQSRDGREIGSLCLARVCAVQSNRTRRATEHSCNPEWGRTEDKSMGLRQQRDGREEEGAGGDHPNTGDVE